MYNIKRNKHKQYKLITSLSLSKSDWISENEVKSLLIDDAYLKFLENVKMIDIGFPNTYPINGKIKEQNDFKYYEWLKENFKREDIEKEASKIFKKLKITQIYKNNE